MEEVAVSSSPTATVPVNFVAEDALVPEPRTSVPSTDAGGRAPRNTGNRHIDFVDDGKLFEGHFTVQSRNLKTIVEFLLDRHKEQDIVIQDLQQQVHLLRTRHLKPGKRSITGEMQATGATAHLRPDVAAAAAAYGAGADGGGGGTSADVLRRLRRVEQFMQLWGVRPTDVADLVELHGDPSLTPEEYTGYLLSLPAFRLTRQEAQRGSLAANTAIAADTASRRRASAARGEQHVSAPVSHINTDDASAGNEGGTAAKMALEQAAAALEMVEALTAEVHSAAAAPGSRRAAREQQGPSFPAEGGTVDAAARADIEELGDYVIRRLDAVEARLAYRQGAGTPPPSSGAPQQSHSSGGGGSAERGRGRLSPSSVEGGGVDAPAMSDTQARRAKAAAARGGAGRGTEDVAEAREFADSTSGGEAPSDTRARRAVARVTGAATARTPVEEAESSSAAASDTQARRAKAAARRQGESNTEPVTGDGRSAHGRDPHAHTTSSPPLSSPLTAPSPPPLPRATNTIQRTAGSGFARAEETVDRVAREDAAESLAMLAELESVMDRRFRELQASMTRAANRSPSAGMSPPQSRQAAVPDSNADALAQSRTASSNSRGGKSAVDTSPSGAAGPLIPERQSSGGSNRKNQALGPTVDTVAREETAALADRVTDLEAEMLDRLQSLEERLRIIGRTTMRQSFPGSQSDGGGSGMSRSQTVDRKARDDVALALMRLQQLERDLAQVKQNAMRAASGGAVGSADDKPMSPFTSSTPAWGNGSDGPGPMQRARIPTDGAATAPLRDTYGSKVANLEKEVEQRMAEVNQAIAQLRGVGGHPSVLTAPPQGDPRVTAMGDTAGPTTTTVTPTPPSKTAAAKKEAADTPPATAAAAPVSSPFPNTARLTPTTVPKRSQLVLQAQNTDVSPNTYTPPPADGREAIRYAAQRSLLSITCDDDALSDADRVLDLPRTNLRVGTHRTTISRLRSPDDPPFGSHLVQREVVELPAELLEAEAAAGQPAAVQMPTTAVPVAAMPLRQRRKAGPGAASPPSTARGSVSTSPSSQVRVS